MNITFVVPNRTDPDKPPTLYERWYGDAAPREGETVAFLGEDGEPTGTWVVKWVRHSFQLGQPQAIEVRLIEP